MKYCFAAHYKRVKVEVFHARTAESNLQAQEIRSHRIKAPSGMEIGGPVMVYSVQMQVLIVLWQANMSWE